MDLQGKENGYPGGAFFDPLGYSRGSEAKYQEYKWKEIKNGRLALVRHGSPVRLVQQLNDHGVGPTPFR